MHNLVENKLRKLALPHTFAAHDSCVIIIEGNDQSNISKIDLVLLPVVPVFPLLIRDNDVSTISKRRQSYQKMVHHMAVFSLGVLPCFLELSAGRVRCCLGMHDTFVDRT